MSNIPEYKKAPASVNNPSRKSVKKRYRESALLPIGIIVGVIFFFSTGYWLGNNMSADVVLEHDNKALSANNTLIIAKNNELQRQNNVLSNRLKEREDKLTFYETLPQQKVSPEASSKHKTEHKTEHKTVKKQVITTHDKLPEARVKQNEISDIIRTQLQTDTKNGQYSVQLASFTKRSDAEALHGKLAKKNITTHIKAANLANKGTRFRIISGPYASKKAAESAKKNIAKTSGFNGIVLNYE
ncbi:MAG: SPOR domain-containing protein [Mariprofundales bacterium]